MICMRQGTRWLLNILNKPVIAIFFVSALRLLSMLSARLSLHYASITLLAIGIFVIQLPFVFFCQCLVDNLE